jgi:peptide/nickel transport system substrate-binding protein
MKERYGLVLESLGKPGGNAPFIMPKRVAVTPADKQIDDMTGSGPFVFKRDEWRPGERVVYIRNPRYRPRAEAASGMAGGKVAKVDRVEWVIIRDAQTAINALAAGEVDMIDSPAYEQYPSLEGNTDIQMVATTAVGSQFSLHFNHRQPPFDNPKVRQAAMAGLNQPAFLRTQVGIPDRYRTCFSVYPCNTKYFSTNGMDFIAQPNVTHARHLLAASGYNGTPVVVMQPTDNAVVAKLPVVAAQLLREVGFRVEVQSMDWQTLLSRRAKKDGWNIFLTGSTAGSVFDPVSNQMLSGACDKAFVGWSCDSDLEKLRDEFAREGDNSKRQALAARVQVRAMEVGTHVPLGEYVRATAARKTVRGLVTGYCRVLESREAMMRMKRPSASSRLHIVHMCSLAVLGLAGTMVLLACAPVKERMGEKVLRVVPQSDLEILDPIWTTALVTQNHGYMIYDTLFGMDTNGQISPQMVDTYDVSPNKKIWTFTLRDDLKFHDGLPVASDDVIASLRRWGQRDITGRKLMSFVEKLEAVNAKTFRMTLTEPYTLVLESLGKPGSNAPFIMPRRIAMTSASTQIDDTTGSGPFVFKKDEWKPGEKVVYVRNAKYRPRAELASGTAGGKLVKVDRVEWVIIKDPQTQANALTAGEIDLIDGLAYELYSSLQRNPDIWMVETNVLGYRFYLRFNHLQPPFDNPKVRQAAMAALNQPAFLQTQVGIPDMYHTCFSIYSCNSPYATTLGMDFIAKPDADRARQLMRDSGYDGTPVALLHQTDAATEAKLAPVAKQLLTQAGLNVDMQSMDRETLGTRRARKDGWSVFLGSGPSNNIMNPFSTNMFSGEGFPNAWYGWPSDQQLEKLRDAFALAGDERERKALAERIQVRAMQIGALVPLGEYVIKVAARKNVTGFVDSFFTVLWSVEKQ